MDELGYTSALVLAVLFAWAGGAKLAARAPTAASFRGLGLPAAEELAFAVPLAEIAVAAGLVIVPRPAAWIAIGLLAAFTVVLVRAVGRGLDVGCACFGAARREPVSVVDVIRNALLIVLAAVATRAGTEWPGLAAVVLVTTAAALGRVALEALALRLELGQLWGTVLPGEGR